MLTVKIDTNYDHAFDNVDDAIKYITETNFEHEITMYDINTNKAYHKALEIYKTIKEYNKGKPLDEQILPTNPYAFRGIVGCLGVQAYSIGLGTYKRNHKCIALFSGHNDSVLDTSAEPADVTPGLKALTSLAMFYKIMNGSDEL